MKKAVLISFGIFLSISLMSQDVIEMEYFFDDDPGYGLATPVAITPGTTINEVINVPTGSLSVGFHDLYVRVKESGGTMTVTPIGGSFEVGEIISGGTSGATAQIVAAFPNRLEILTIGTFTLPETITGGTSAATATLSAFAANWSIPESRLVYLDPTGAGMVQVDALEYFIDTDPGYGMGTSFTAFTAAAVVNEMANIPTGALSLGFHTLYVRARAVGGTWGIPESRVFFIDPTAGGGIILIDELEYFIDTDPGYGMGTSFTAFTAANVVNQMENIPTGALSIGFHTLFVRGKSVEGTWGIPESRIVYVDPSGGMVDVEEIEYFFDADPGYGSGTKITAFTAANIINQVENIATGSLSVGFHTLFIRAKSVGNTWGIPESRIVYVDPSGGINADITALEYFVDTDPGYGLATPIPVTTSALNVQEMFTVLAASLPIGQHTLGVRAQNADGVWGMLEAKSVEVIPENTLDFDGIDDFVAIPDNALLETNPITIEFWFKKNNSTVQDSDGFDDTEGLLYKSPNTSTPIAYGFQILDTDTGPGSTLPFDLGFVVGDGSINTSVIADAAIDPGAWYHVAGVINGNNIELFLNGVSQGTDLTPSAPTSNNDPLVLGKVSSSSLPTRFFNGQIDELRIWNSARTQTEIQDNRFVSLVGDEADLAAYYDFNQGIADGNNSGETGLTDRTANALSGTLNTFALAGTTSNWVASDALDLLPEPPSGLLVTEVSVNQIDLSWNDNASNETGYIIERSDGDNTNFQELATVAADSESYSDFGLSPNAGYFYRVTATNMGTNSVPTFEKFGSTLVPPGNALSFDGTDDYVEIPDNDVVFERSGGFTLEAWIKPTNLNNTSQHIAGINNSYRILIDTDNQLQLGTFDGSTFTNATSPTALLTQGVNTHVAATFDGTDGRLYVNGVEVHFESGVSVPQNLTDPFFIGGLDFTGFFFGEIDEVRLWDNARNELEIRSTLGVTLIGNEPGLVAYYRFDQDETTDLLLPDRTLSSNVGIWKDAGGGINTPQWVPSGGLDSEVLPNHALDFDATDDYVSIPHVTAYNTNPLTIEFWFFKNTDFNEDTPGLGDVEFLVGKRSSSTSMDGHFNFTLGGSNAPFSLNFTAGNGTIGLTVSQEVDPFRWYHAAGVINGNVIELYVDGVFVGQQDLGSPPQFNTAPIDIATTSAFLTPERFLNGKIDELRIWDKALTQAEIQANIANEIEGNSPNLIGYYDFNQGVPGGVNSGINMLRDLSSTANDGVLNNLTLSGSASNWVNSGSLDPTPNDPTHLTVNDNSGAQIDLSWTDKAFNETGYTVERATGSNNTFSILTTVPANSSTYTDTGVSPNTGYYYRVIANGGVLGDSGPSNEKFGSTLLAPGNTLSFDGNDNSVDLSNALSHLAFNAPATIEFWAKINYDHTIALNYKTVLSIGEFANDEFVIGLGDVTASESNELLAIQLTTAGGANRSVVNYVDGTNVIGEWHHYAISADGNTFLIYVDGQPVTATPVVGGGFTNAFIGDYGDNLTSPTKAYLGQREGENQFFDGQLDEVRIWNTVRTESEIQSTQYTTLVGDEAGLVAYYRFDQGVAGIPNNSPAIALLPDRSINQNDGMLMGFDYGAQSVSVSNWVASTAPLVGSGVIQQDIDALTDFYNDLNGAGWTNNTGWLSGDPSGWFGLTTANNRVTEISLPTNNLSGDMTSSFQNLTGLQTLNISGNEVTALPDLSGLPNASPTSLTPLSLDVSNNRLDFVSLEPNNGIAGRVFSPQKTFFAGEDILSEVGTEVTINRLLGGTANVYTWFKNEVEIGEQTATSLTFPSVQFTDEGTYRAEVTNSTVQDVTLTTANYILKVSSLERDRIALNNIYTATDGDNWTDNTGWDSDDLSTRFGVTVANNRVTALSLPANNLQGNMPIDLKDIGQITIIELQDNELRAFPDVSSLTDKQLTTLNVTNNRLGFGDLIPNLPVSTFSFDPQRRYGITLNEQLPLGADFELSISMPGDGNAYQWFRKERRTPEEVDGLTVDGATMPTYSIEGINFDKMGIYYVEVTNPAIPGFTIRNRNQNVFAITDINGTVFLNEQAGLL